MVSELVLDEAGAGDESAAAARLAAIADLAVLDATEEAEELAGLMIRLGAVPAKAVANAAHITIAVTNGVEYLVTWNCRHIANATFRTRLEKVCQDAGYQPTIICTPDELTEADDEDTAE